MPLNAGHLDRRVTIQRRTTDIDALGQEAGEWVVVATVWAQPMPAKGREYFAASQMQAEGAMAWRIRYRADIAATMRIVDDIGQYWDIAAPPVPGASREWLDLYCLSGVRDGR